jgi:hypothetical protein
MLHAFFISDRPAILPSNGRMIPDEIVMLTLIRVLGIATYQNATAGT